MRPEPEYESLIPYGDLSHASLLLAAEEARMYREGYTREDVAAWLREHGGQRFRMPR